MILVRTVIPGWNLADLRSCGQSQCLFRVELQVEAIWNPGRLTPRTVTKPFENVRTSTYQVRTGKCHGQYRDDNTELEKVLVVS